jgi:hypothetical protein
VRDRILDLDERERARLIRLLGAIGEPQGRLGRLRDVLRAIATLDEEELEVARIACTGAAAAWSIKYGRDGLRRSRDPRR